MAPLVVLTVSFFLLLLLRKCIPKVNFIICGRIAFALMFTFTGVSHFFMTDGMVMSLFSFIPFKRELVYLTGFFEIALGIAFALSRNVRVLSRVIIAFLVLVLPSNIYAAVHHIDMKHASFDGPGLPYLLFRVPLQALLIFWVYYFGGLNPVKVPARK